MLIYIIQKHMQDPIMTVYLLLFAISFSIALIIHQAYNYRHKYGKTLADVLGMEILKDNENIKNFKDVIKWSFASNVRKRTIAFQTTRKDVIIFLVLAVIMTIFYVSNIGRSGVLICALLVGFMLVLFKKWLWKKLESGKDSHTENNLNQVEYDKDGYNQNGYDKYGFTKDNAVRSKDGEFKSSGKKLWFYLWLFWGILVVILIIVDLLH